MSMASSLNPHTLRVSPNVSDICNWNWYEEDTLRLLNLYSGKSKITGKHCVNLSIRYKFVIECLGEKKYNEIVKNLIKR